MGKTGQACPAQRPRHRGFVSYVGAEGFFPLEWLDTFRKADGQLSGHAEMRHVPGVDMSTGSLGQGLSAAVGMALAGKCRDKDHFTYAIVGDGEIQEGQIWEALMFAAARRLDNLIVILDNNKVQLDGQCAKYWIQAILRRNSRRLVSIRSK